MNYATLQARLEAYLVEDTTDDTWNIAIASIIEAGELRCFRDVDFLAARKTATLATIAGTRTLSTPADWLIGRDVFLATGAGFAGLERRERSFLLEYAPNPAATGTPKYWTEAPAGTIYLAPTPNSVGSLDVSYTARLPGLSPTNNTTWLGTNCPDLLFAACMVHGAGYQRDFGAQADDPKSAVSWEAVYQTELLGARREESRRKGEGSFEPSPAPPVANNSPPGS